MLSEPAQLRAAMAYTSYIAHAASTLTVQGRLETRGLPPTLRGGLLAVEDAGGALRGRSARAAGSVYRALGRGAARGAR